MRKPIILICSELTSILEHNILEIEKKLYKIKADSSLNAPIFLYSYAMFEGAIAMLMTKFCSVFLDKIAKEAFSNIEKEDLILNISNREAIESIAEKFVMKITYGNTEQWIKQLVDKYHKYNKEYLIRNVWRYLFETSLLDFMRYVK